MIKPEEVLSEYHPPLTDHEAMVEANRCLYCFDAPCTQACPTHIDIPKKSQPETWWARPAPSWSPT